MSLQKVFLTKGLLCVGIIFLETPANRCATRAHTEKISKEDFLSLSRARNKPNPEPRKDHPRTSIVHLLIHTNPFKCTCFHPSSFQVWGSRVKSHKYAGRKTYPIDSLLDHLWRAVPIVVLLLSYKQPTNIAHCCWQKSAEIKQVEGRHYISMLGR